MANYVGLIISIAIVVALFLIFREIICWYWKMNETTMLLREIRDSVAYLKPDKVDSSTEAPDTAPDK